MTGRTVFATLSWTHNFNSEQQQDHDFCNLLQEFAYAVDRQDRPMKDYCEHELKRMFRERKITPRRQRQANAPVDPDR